MNFKRVAIIGSILVSMMGCSKENIDRILYSEKINLYDKGYLVEVRALEDGQGRRLRIYEQGVERAPDSTSKWAGVSFARDDNGDGKIYSLKGPILGLIYSIDKTGNLVKSDRENSEYVTGKHEQVIKKSKENKNGWEKIRSVEKRRIRS